MSKVNAISGGNVNQEILDVAINAIRVSPFQPRKLFSEGDLKKLSQSIASIGLLHPPVVRKIQSNGKVLYYELISGERRWRALKLLGKENIPVLVVDSNDAVAAEATLVENLQRVDLNPIEIAEALKNLIEAFSLTQDKVAIRVGKKRSTVANYLRLLNLPESVRLALSSSLITMGHAKVILSLSETFLQEQLLSTIIKKKLSVKESEKEANCLVRKRENLSENRVKNNLFLDTSSQDFFINSLSEYLSLPVSIRMQGEKGHFSITFSSQEELEKIKEIFSEKIV